MNARTSCKESRERVRSLVYLELAEYIDVIVPGAACVGAAIFYLLVEILGYQPVSIPSLRGARWLRFIQMSALVLVGLALLIAEGAISAPVLFRALFQRDFLAPFSAPCLALAPLLVLCLLVMLRSAVGEIQRALVSRRWRREQQ